MKKKSRYNPTVPSVEQAIRILLHLGRGPTFNKTLGDVCHELGIYKSKGFTLLNTLIKFNLVEKDNRLKTYSLGPGLISLSRYYLEKINYPTLVAPFLADLAQKTNGTALFAIINGDYLFVVAKFEGNQNVGLTINLGHRFHITLGSHGRSIAAFMSEDRRKELLSQKKLYFYGDPSHFDMKRLKNELDECRQKGFATDIGEITPGVSIISSPIFRTGNEVIGCINLMGTFNKNVVSQYGEQIVINARQISYKLGADLSTISFGKQT